MAGIDRCEGEATESLQKVKEAFAVRTTSRSDHQRCVTGKEDPLVVDVNAQRVHGVFRAGNDLGITVGQTDDLAVMDETCHAF